MNRKLMVGAVVAAAVVIVVGVAVWVNPELRARLFSLEKPERAPQIIVGNFIDASLYEIEQGVLKEVSIASEGSITSRSRGPEHTTASSVFLPAGTLGNEILLEDEKGSRILELPFSIKDTPSLSLDGAYIAYAELAPESIGTLYSEEVSEWRIKVVHLASGKQTDLGVGFAPYFISDSPRVVLFSTPEGVAAVNLDNKERSLLKERPVAYTPQAARVSFDGHHLASYNPTTRAYTLFSITNPETLEVSALGEVPVALSPVALSNTALYGVQRDETTNLFTLWKYPLKDLAPLSANGTLIFTFEPGHIPYQIVP